MLHIEGVRDHVHVPISAFDHAGFRAWVTSADFPEKLRVTFVAGEVLVEMSPESIETHNKVKAAITITLGGIIASRDLGEAWMDGVLLTSEGAELSTEPDFAFASWTTLEAGRVTFVRKADRDDEFVEIVGAPDLVVEVVSASSVKKDLEWLRAAYARAGVREYWLVDARGQELRFEILVLEAGSYAVPSAAGEPQYSGVLGRSFALERAYNRLGRYSYSLRVAE
jgi:Uma2 family endonuclease